MSSGALSGFHAAGKLWVAPCARATSPLGSTVVTHSLGCLASNPACLGRRLPILDCPRLVAALLNTSWLQREPLGLSLMDALLIHGAVPAGDCPKAGVLHHDSLVTHSAACAGGRATLMDLTGYALRQSSRRASMHNRTAPMRKTVQK